MTHRFAFSLLFAFAAFTADAFGAVLPLLGVDQQHAAPGQLFPNPIAVQVTDRVGQPVQGAVVRWSFNAISFLQMESFSYPTCSFDAGWLCSAKTDASGIAVLGRMYGTRVGSYGLVVEASEDPLNPRALGEVTITLVVDAASTPEISVVSGNAQRAVIGTDYASPFVARVVRDGAPVANALVYFLVAGGEWFAGAPVGTFNGGDGAAVTTDANGYATSPTFKAGWGVGTGTVRVTLSPQASATPASIAFTNTSVRGDTTLDLQDLWWAGPQEAGWGVSIHQHGDKLFSILFAYDDQGSPTWRVMSDGKWTAGLGSHFDTVVHEAHGSAFVSYDASLLSLTRVGSVYLSFEGEQAGNIGGFINLPWLPPGFGGISKGLRRWDFSGMSTEPLHGVADLWWGGPSQSGWGISIFERPGALFAMWFTYDDAGKAMWFVMPEGRWTSANVYEGRIYSARGSGWPDSKYDASKFQATDVGAFALRFTGSSSAQFEYAVNGRSGTLPLTRTPFGDD